MTERYEQPRSPEAPPKYATPFEMAIYEYEKRAHSYCKAGQAGALANENKAEREKIIKE